MQMLKRMKLISLIFAYRVDVGKLEKAMIYKRIVTREGSIDKELDPNSAVVSRDGLAKTIYSRLFDWYSFFFPIYI